MASQGKKFCKHCGAEIDDECVVCPKCGKQVEKLESGAAGDGQPIIINNNNNASASASAVAGGGVGMTVSPKSWLTTLLLCLFLGWLGVHRFYVGKVITGILLVLLMFTGIGEVWLFVDFLVILFKNFKDKDGLRIVN